MSAIRRWKAAGLMTGLVVLVSWGLAAPALAQSPCGGDGQRACCFLENLAVGACNDGLANVDGCDDATHGDCTCPGLGESNSHCEAVSACGGPGQRACCVLERPEGACDDGLGEVAGCDAAANGDCSCPDNELILGIESSSHCLPVTACGGENQRACCALERLPSCDPGLVEIPWCAGDCLCEGIAGNASGTCIAPSPCGGRGQRACCVAERPDGTDCDEDLTAVPGCTGNCFCGGAGGGNVSSSMCTVMEPMSEPGTNWTPPASGPECPLYGFAEMHMHMFSNLANYRGVQGGASYDPVGGVNAALGQDFGTYLDLVAKDGAELPAPNCPSYIPDCGDRVLHGDHFRPFDDPVGFGTKDDAASPLGAPIFSGWPTWRSTTHQQVYYKWLERAWRGGLRMILMYAVSNEALCRANMHMRGTDCTKSMIPIDAQLDEAWAFQQWLDDQSGGDGAGWFRIVTTPQQAREAIAAGKMAVMLGIEVDNLFDCHDADRLPGGRCSTREQIEAMVDAYHAKGVRAVFPIHNFDNSFGGPATWQDGINIGNRVVEGHWWSAEDCSDEGYGFKLTRDVGDALLIFIMGWFGFGMNEVPLYLDQDASCNVRGLTPQGEWLMTALMDRGIMIDIDHMSRLSIDATLDMAEARSPVYPVIASHVLPLEMHAPEIRHERMRTREQLERIRDGGGIVTMMLKDDVQDADLGKRRSLTYPGRSVPDDCRHSTKSWAQSYLYLADLMNGPIAMGSDFNGVAGHVGPRFGDEACGGDLSNGGIGLERSTQYRTSSPLQYPFTLPGLGTFDRQKTGDKTFDFNHDGMAHAGLLPDFIADLRTIGVTDADLQPLFESAEGLVRTWERATSGAPLVAATAQCENRTVAADETCRAEASVAAGVLDGDATVSLTQSPGGPYALGETQVTLVAQPTLTCDPSTSCEATVTVVDETPPSVTCPAAPAAAECTGPGSATAVSFAAAEASDNCSPLPQAGCSPASGSGFPLGGTQVVCSAPDDAGNVGDCAFQVDVQDTTPPGITAPADLPAVECASPLGTPAILGAPVANDICDSALSITNDAPDAFASHQTTTVTWIATDDSGNAASDTQAVTVVDTTRPVVECAVEIPLLIEPWPPSHDLVNVGLTATATDTCDGELPVVVRVFANEDDQTQTAKREMFSPDARNLATGSLRLRMERAETGQGRVYLVVTSATDAGGNLEAACCSVVVPKSQSVASLAAARNAAASARAACEASNGSPPAGYFTVGDGPVIGPKQ